MTGQGLFRAAGAAAARDRAGGSAGQPGIARDGAAELVVSLKGGKELQSLDLRSQPEIRGLPDVVDVEELTA